MTSTRFAPLDLTQFKSPGARPRIAPFWFWNCGMGADKVRHQVQQMAEAGCGGFFIHPRQGLTLPYLSKEWFARIRIAVEEAQRHGLEAWLYDEYPYPSGIAGGLLTANHPEFRERVLEHKETDIPGGQPAQLEISLGRLVYALACPVKNGRLDWKRAIDIREKFGVVLTREQFWYWPMGHIPTNEKRFMADEGRLVLDWTPPRGEWRVFTGVERDQRGFKYYDCFFDPLVPGAAQEFLRLTHDRYAAELSEFFGNTIPGIFTDETEPPSWSPQIENALHEELGLDFAQIGPALRCDEHPRAAEVRFQWRKTALRLFQERWEKPIADWCRDHQLIWGAEKPTWRPAQFWNVAEPSTDAGHRRIPAPPELLTADLRANHRAAMAAAEQSGGETVRCECFHSLGWGATLQDQKWSIDWLAVQGVNRFTPHAFYATSSGLQKHDAAPSFFAENPYWSHFQLLADYTARLSLAMSSGRERARIAVIHPTEALWSGGKVAQTVRAAYEKLQNDLLSRHFQFHVVDARALLEAKAQNNGLEIGNARYEAVIVPPLIYLDEEIEVALAKARDCGLTMLGSTAMGSIEHYRDLSIRDELGEEIESVWVLWRETKTQELVFFANTSGQAVTAHVEVTSDAQAWSQWSLESGEVASHPAQCKDGKSRFVLRLPPYASAFLEGVVHAGAPVVTSVHPRLTETLSLEGDWALELDRSNALRLNHWSALSSAQDCSPRDFEDSTWLEIEALPLRHLDQTGGGWLEKIERCAGESVWYRRRVNCDFVPENLEILIEDGAILGNWKLFINGTEVSQEAFGTRSYNGEDKTSTNISALFEVGENILTLKVDDAPAMGGLRTPLHLLGDFALGGDESRTLTALPVKVSLNRLSTSGLPHFSGTAAYHRMENIPAGVVIEMPKGFGDVAEVSVNGISLGVRAWSPYRWEVPASVGPVKVEIAVTNTLLPFVEGQVWDSAATQPTNV